MNKAKELKDIISVTELDPSKTYLIGVKGDPGGGNISALCHDLQRIGIEEVLIVPEDWIKSVNELSEEEADKIVEKIREKVFNNILTAGLK